MSFVCCSEPKCPTSPAWLWVSFKKTNVPNTQESAHNTATIGQYADYHSESWVIKDGQWVWDEEMFDSPEESARWKEHVAENGSVFGLDVSNTQEPRP